MDKSFRIHTNIVSDTLLKVNMQQDFDFLEVLSLKLRQKDAYRLHSSNYGVIIGRVLANDAFGIPNAKVSIFIERDTNDSTDMEALYPYSEVTTKDKEGRRYNILPDYSDDDCYRVVGTFPNKRLMLDDDIQLEVYDKYYKYTTVTNNAGDYMIFGVPTGSTTVHVDIDLSDIGVLSQRPYDFEYKGYNLTMFDSPSQFKESTNLDSLAQLFSQNRSVFVYPFWGDADNGIASITRADIQIQYKFEPTCVFMGSIVSDNEGHAIGHRCAPDIENGMNDQLVAGSGTIEMIRKTTDGLVEEYQIQGNQLIDENGVWCYQIPMNLDYIGTDEYGNIVPTDNPNKGIPTRTQVRFRFSKNETTDEGFSRHTAKYLVPMNPIFSEENVNFVDTSNDGSRTRTPGEIPVIPVEGAEIEKMYTFGSSTPIHCFRDLYWNNVYSVKNYIPKVQVAHRAHSKNYGALKGSNLAKDQNPIPFNKLRVDLPFLYMVVCILYTIMVWVVKVINLIISFLHFLVYEFCFKIPVIRVKLCPFGVLKYLLGDLSCITMSAGSDEGNVAYYPGCSNAAMDDSDCPEDMQEEGCVKRSDSDELMDKIQRNLAQEFKIIKLDLYQDWINGCLYMPLWYWKKRKKRTFLFFTISGAKNEYCSDSRRYSRLKTYVTCNIRYHDRSLTVSNNRDSMPDSEDRWHKNRKNQIRYKSGLIKPVINRDGLTAYYYVAVQATTDNANDDLDMAKRGANFRAIRLYATDIILLGNLNPNNIYGIPQFFKCLPSTTANIPPIATIEEIPDPNQKEEIEDDIKGAEDSGDTISTGMDWNHNGGSMTPRYKTGLFMDLACTWVGTRPKSCINVERISELGVALDTRHKIPYHEGGEDIQYGSIDTDGFISKYELDDMENRAMFATLNHIGFIPQEYQNKISGYTTQVYDKNTNYLIPKFKYIYPVDFDGRLQVPMDLYNWNRNAFEQAMFDERDESYLTFRFGAEDNGDKDKSPNKNNQSEGRIRHFYHTDLYDMPLYNNSYYFYFGVNKGKTAIDKFNKLFYAPCVQNEKSPFTIDITSQGRSYCPETYTSVSCDCPTSSSVTESEYSGICRYSHDANINKAYGYIRVTSDDIKKPYSYRLYDQFNDIIVEDNGMNVDSFVIGGQIDNSGNTVSNCNGWIFHQIKNNNDKYERIDENLLPYYSSGLTNQEYILEVTDADGRTITEKIKLDTPKITGEYRATKLGAKFYNSATTRIDYICHDNNAFYGKIEMASFSVDGYKCNITGVEYFGYNTANDRYTFCVSGSSNDISDIVVAYLELMVFKSNNENLARNCLCDNNSDINIIRKLQGQESEVKMSISGTSNNYFLSFREQHEEEGRIVPSTVTFYIYQPNRYAISITQGCTGCSNLIVENSTTEILDVMNGEPFITTLNSMPTKFMLGTVNDNNNADIANTSYFYSRNVSISTIDSPNNDEARGAYHLKGWYGTHQEDSYMFSRREENKTYVSNQSVWDDVFNSTKDMVSSPKMKRYALKFKFDKMFSLSEGVYVTTDSSKKFEFKATGGINPILYRSVIPMYEDVENLRNRYILRDTFTSTCLEEYPNIIGQNYSRPNENDYGYTPGFIPQGPMFNSAIYENSAMLGNYFAAFTRDGSYISKNKIDGININIERSPSFASISPMSGLKIKGKDVQGSITNFEWVYNKKNQHLEGDINRNTLPYLRALYLDRRFDYDLTFLAPVISDNFSLYPNSQKARNRTWKSGRMSGWTYNGIEMSYDNDYNTISAHTESANTRSYSPTGEDYTGTLDIEYTAATFNRRLEYTYKYDCADLCMTCGHQEKNMWSGCTKCGSNNINHFHGEIGEEHISKQTQTHPMWELTNHSIDKTNFNDGSIPQKILPNNETKYTLDDAITYYHRWCGNEKFDWANTAPRWGKWNTVNNFGYDIAYDGDEDDEQTEMLPLFKEFYSSTLNNFDIRHLYWSLFNYYRLKLYTEKNKEHYQNEGFGENAIDNEINPFYVYHYPSLPNFVSDVSTYNGDFNREDAVNGDPVYGKKAYPTKRYIDIGNLPVTSYYEYATESCTYGMQTEITDDGKLRAVTKPSEKTEISFNWAQPIKVISPNGANNEYANITYRPTNPPCNNDTARDNLERFKSCIKFSASTCSIMFKYNSYTCDGFEVYTKVPRLIQVLPYIETPYPYTDVSSPNIDGIGFYKTSNLSPNYGTEEFGKTIGKYGDGYTLDDAINKITLENGVFGQTWYNPFSSAEIDVILPSNISTGTSYTTKYGTRVDGKFFHKGNDWLRSDDDDFTNIVFKKNNLNLYCPGTKQNACVYAILVDREYRYETDDNLVRHLRTVEVSDLFDSRSIFMKTTVKPGTLQGEQNSHGTYVQMRKGNATPISGANSNSIDVETGTTTARTESGDTVTDIPTTDVKVEDTRLGEDTTKIYIQTLTFDMYFDVMDTTPIPDRQNESFANYMMMSYTFRFFNIFNEQYDVSPSEVILLNEDSNEFIVVRFILKWPTNMGIIADTIWVGNNKMNRPIPVELFARTTSDFVYKLTGFEILVCCDNGGQEPGGCGDINPTKDQMDEATSDNPHRYYTHIKLRGTNIIDTCNCE